MPTELFLLALLHEFLSWCELSWQKQCFVSGATALGFNISGPDSLRFLFSPPFLPSCSSSLCLTSFLIVFSTQETKDKPNSNPFPRQQHWRYEPTHYTSLISTVYRKHRNLFIISWRLSDPCCFHIRFLKLLTFAFQEEDLPYQKRANASWPSQPLDSQCMWLGQTGLGKKELSSRWIYEKSSVTDGAHRHLLACPRS